MLSSKNGGIVLPTDVVNDMLMEYCDHETLCNTREFQSQRVRRCTQFDDMKSAIKAGNLENAKWIARRNNEWKEYGNNYLSSAARGGYLQCLKWLFQALGSSVMNEGWLYAYAARGGQLEICTWLLENGCLLTQRAFNDVVLEGVVDVTEWCLQNGGTFDDSTFLFAVHSGNVEVLDWLKVNGCPISLSPAILRYSTSNVFKWLRKNGCPRL